MAERDGDLLPGGTENIQVEVAACSVPSDRHPERNEDAYFINRADKTFGVFDGVSGDQDYKSARAAQLAAETASHHLGSSRARVPRIMSHLVMQEAIFAGHHAILQDPAKGATTAVIAKVFKDEKAVPYAAVASAGDSRPYHFREGVLTHLTVDHTVTTEYYGYDAAMPLQERMANTVALPESDTELMDAFRQKGIITSFLGMREYPPVVAISDFEVVKGDKILLTSDGVHDNLTTDEIAAIIGATYPADIVVRMLVDAAQVRSRDASHFRAKPDDMTAALLVVSEPPLR